MTTDEIKAFVKQYIKENLKIVFDQHQSDGYHDSNGQMVIMIAITLK